MFLVHTILFLNLILVWTFDDCSNLNIYPCKCYHDTDCNKTVSGNIYGIDCDDVEVNEILWNLTSHYSFYDLILFGSNITRITKYSFENVSFNRIWIYENQKLFEINNDSFYEGPKTLHIENNKKLPDDQIFNFVKNNGNLQYLDISKNLKELPSFAFQLRNNLTSKLNKLYLDNNYLTNIKSNTFIGLSKSYLYLRKNYISKIEDFGLTFSNDTTISLAKNNLTENSFTPKSLENNYLLNISIDFSYNSIKRLSEYIFKPFLSNGKNEINLKGNKLECDCGMIWLLEKAFEGRVKNALCYNMQQKNIYKLDKTRFSDCQKILESTLQQSNSNGLRIKFCRNFRLSFFCN